MAPLFRFRSSGDATRNTRSKHSSPVPLPTSSKPLATSYNKPLPTPIVELVSAPPSTTPVAPSLCSENAFRDEGLGDADETRLWLSSSLVGLDAITDITVPTFTYSSGSTGTLTDSESSTGSSRRRKHVPNLLTVQLGPVTAVFEIEELGIGSQSMSSSIRAPAPALEVVRHSKAEDALGDLELESDGGSATDLDSSPRSFGVSSHWSSSSSSGSSSDDESPLSLSDSPSLSRSPPPPSPSSFPTPSGLPPFEVVFPTFAPRTYKSISGLPSPLFDYIPVVAPSTSRSTSYTSVRRKSPPALSAAELDFLEKKEKDERMKKPTRIECGGKSVFIGAGGHARKVSTSSEASGWYWADGEDGEFDDDEEEILVISMK